MIIHVNGIDAVVCNVNNEPEILELTIDIFGHKYNLFNLNIELDHLDQIMKTVTKKAKEVEAN